MTKKIVSLRIFLQIYWNKFNTGQAGGGATIEVSNAK